MKKQQLNRSQVIDLATILYNVRDHVSYVAEKYIKAPLQINHDYRGIGGKKPKIRPVSSTPNHVYSFDNAKTESIAYYSVAILYFINVIEANFSSDCLGNFYRNINTLRIKKLTPKLKVVYNSPAVYFPSLNTIYIRKNFMYTIFHELFHMACSRIINDITYSGFAIIDGKKIIGDGIDEGYTELLSKRYFGNLKTDRLIQKEYCKKNDIGKCYPLQVLIASKLEDIVGKSKMERLYLTSNLYGLCKELEQYSDRKQIERFFANVDFLHKNSDNIINLSVKNKKLHDIYVDVCNFLAECYRKKIDRRYGNNAAHKDRLMADYLLELDHCYDAYFSLDKRKKGKKK